ncbi:hypothetical protein RCA_01980 [Rickettsia canadensis str. CA410]|uniref:Ankyrin repeat protein n=1 Tax=Rickettsia canadensis str. CA410 TaxID=1105107 RepID=A0ABN4A9W7_RICCA|nr:hypothetical protein RCA_01980 [Rickettsia canadensis str. CA410]
MEVIVIENYGAEFTILNVAVKSGSLDIINYLFDKNIFPVSQELLTIVKRPFIQSLQVIILNLQSFYCTKGVRC